MADDRFSRVAKKIQQTIRDRGGLAVAIQEHKDWLRAEVWRLVDLRFRGLGETATPSTEVGVTARKRILATSCAIKSSGRPPFPRRLRMIPTDRRRLVGQISAFGASGVIANLLTIRMSLGQANNFAATPEAVEHWMDDWMKAVKAPQGALIVRRFADPIYFLQKPISWVPNKGQEQFPTVTVPTGFVTDFASIPQIFWSILKPDGLYAYAAVVHDYLYWTQSTSRDAADTILKLAMEDFNVAGATVTAIYEAVNWFGGRAWDENKRLKSNGEKRILEPISKSLEEDDEASELHEAEEVLRIELPADKDAALPLNPGEEPFDQPAPGISAKAAAILRSALAAIDRCGAIISMPSFRKSLSSGSLS